MEAVKQNGGAIEFTSDELKRDREIISEAVRKEGNALLLASEEFRKDRELLIEAVKQYGRALQWAPKEFKNDREIDLFAVKEYGSAIDYTSSELKCDREFVLQAVKLNGMALQYVSFGLRNDREIVMEAVKQNGWALECVSRELRKDREIVVEAVKQNGTALEYAPEELRNDREIVLLAINQNISSFKYVSDELRNDREIAMLAVKKDGYAIEKTSSELRNDREIVTEAVKQNGLLLSEASEELRNDCEIVLLAFKNNESSLVYASEELKADGKFIQLLRSYLFEKQPYELPGYAAPSTLIKFSTGKQYRNMMENSFRDVVCKFREYSFLIREKSFYDYLKPEFMQQYKIERNLSLFVSEIWSGTSATCVRGGSGLNPYVLVVPRLELVEQVIRDYLEWWRSNDLFNSVKYWNDFDIFRIADSNTDGRGELKSVFEMTCFTLEEGEYVKNISDKGYFEMTFLTNLGHFYHIIQDRNGGKNIITKSAELFTGLAVGGSFWIGWTSTNLFLFGHNFYIHMQNRKASIPSEILSIDDVSCGWDNIFIVANSRKDVFGFGRNFGSFFTPNHKQTPNIVQIPLDKLKLPEETIQKVSAADEAAVILLDSGNLIINNYALNRTSFSIFSSKLWTRIDAAKTLNKFQDSRIIDVGVGRSKISVLTFNHCISVYSLDFTLEFETKLHISCSLDYPLFVMNKTKIVDESKKRIVQESFNPSLIFNPTIIQAEESVQVWYHAHNPIDLFQSDYRRNMISSSLHFSDLQFNFV
ncbi:predicted protein [Naegleria gruberi]|uniref:Predicted protein n=1 Tax=Naegleria gruberi TaxID=5762 RepID=D2VNX3_NAEGR|nr:uncharacterized protein NAEGRDRAFT_51103 [Naegleria gruberi]EFC41494.1 predicted protein [Naegleria gruberi]|eukprot:XP_002674238.1 predicted protein [Naegleria gruberi strain NEG-M]